jgi:hypothetical protein
MNFSFQASSKTSSDWMLLKMLRDPSKKWRVDMYGQSMGEERWLPLFSKVVGLSDDPSDMGSVFSEGISTVPPLPLVEPRVIPNESMRLLERVEGSWL